MVTWYNLDALYSCDEFKSVTGIYMYLICL